MPPLRRCLVLLLAAGTTLAQHAPPAPPAALDALAPAAPLPPQAFQARRAALAAAAVAAHPGRRLVVAVRGGARAADMSAFVQDQDFLYLTGVAEPGLAMLLVVSADGALQRDELLVPPFSRFAATWDGRFLAPGDEAAQRTGFRTCGNVRRLGAELDELVSPDADGQRPIVLVLQQPAARLGSTPRKAAEAAQAIADDRFDGRSSREQAFAATLRQRHEGLELVALEPLLHPLRTQKSDPEIELLRQSARIAAAGIAEAMRGTRPGLFEYQVAAAARFTFSLHGAGPDAYAAIVGGGPNGCILHYNACDRRLEPDDLIVMDYAPTLHGYASDVTRTFPASGRFTEGQRKLVQDVHDVQQQLLAMVRPGARLSAIGARCAELLRERGYRNDHGPCHHVGLAVHDPSVDVLQAGMVITVEPGAYLRDQGMGCRIEDTVLVTADGCEVLSVGVPSTPDAIEALMAAPGLLDAALGPGR